MPSFRRRKRPEATPDAEMLQRDFPVVQKRFEPGGPWSLVLPRAFNVRVEPEGGMVIWRPGMTIFMTIWSAKEDAMGLDLIRLLDGPSPERPGRADIEEVEEDGVARLAFRDDKVDEGGPRRLLGLVAGEKGHLDLTVCFDEETDANVVWDIVRSVRSDVKGS